MNITTSTNPRAQLVKALATLCKQTTFWNVWNYKSSFWALFVINDGENLKSDIVQQMICTSFFPNMVPTTLIEMKKKGKKGIFE
jgi:hypothetical protein